MIRSTSSTSWESLIDRYVKGLTVDSEQYSTIIRAIHYCLQKSSQSPPFHKLSGAIVFCRYDAEEAIIENRMKMKVFVLNEHMLSPYKEKSNLLAPILEKVCGDLRPYREMDHFEHFRTNYDSKKHWTLVFKNDDYTPNLSFEEVANRLIENKDAFTPRQLDAYIFPFSEALVIPIPVLSSPSFLLLLDLAQMRDAVNSFTEMSQLKYIRQVQRRASEMITAHISQRLLSEFNQFSENNDAVFMQALANEKGLLQYFSRNIANILLPIRYSIWQGQTLLDSREGFNWFEESDTNCERTPSRKLNLSLLKGKYSISFTLPTFLAPANSDGVTAMIHLGDEYRVKSEQIKNALENLFDLIHRFWQRVGVQNQFSRHILQQAIYDSSNLNPSNLKELIARQRDIINQSNDLLSDLTRIQLDINALEKIDFAQSQPFKRETILRTDEQYTFILRIDERLTAMYVERNPEPREHSFSAGLDHLHELLVYATSGTGHKVIGSEAFTETISHNTLAKSRKGLQIEKVRQLFDIATGEVSLIGKQILHSLVKLTDQGDTAKNRIVQQNLLTLNIENVPNIKKLLKIVLLKAHTGTDLTQQNLLELMKTTVQFSKELLPLNRVVNYIRQNSTRIRHPQEGDQLYFDDNYFSNEADRSSGLLDDEERIEGSRQHYDSRVSELGAQSWNPHTNEDWQYIAGRNGQFCKQLEGILSELYPQQMESIRSTTQLTVTKELNSYWATNTASPNNALITKVHKSLKAAFNKLKSNKLLYDKLSINFIQAGLAEVKDKALVPIRRDNNFFYDQSKIIDSEVKIQWQFQSDPE